MTDLFTPPRAVAAVKFKWQKSEDTKTYDYFVPTGLDLAAGDLVMVETKRGETEVQIVELKTSSDMASKEILRRAEPAAPTGTNPEDDWNF